MVDGAVVLVDRLGTFCDVNAAFERLTGYDRLEVIGRPSNLLASGRHDREFYRSMWRVLQRGARWEGRVCDKLRDGSHQWFRLRITPLWDEGGNKTHFLGVLGPCSSVHCHPEQREGSLGRQRDSLSAQRSFASLRMTGRVAPAR